MQRAPRRIPSIVWIFGGFLAGVLLGCPLLNRTGDVFLFGLAPAFAGAVCGAWFARSLCARDGAAERREAEPTAESFPGWLAAGLFFLIAGPALAAVVSLATGSWNEPAALVMDLKVGFFAGVLGFVGALVARIVGG